MGIYENVWEFMISLIYENVWEFEPFNEVEDM
jgi:hypothetical protein